MSNYKVLFTIKARKDIQRLDQYTAKRLVRKIEYFTNHQPLLSAVRLTKITDAQYRKSKTIIILKISTQKRCLCQINSCDF